MTHPTAKKRVRAKIMCDICGKEQANIWRHKRNVQHATEQMEDDRLKTRAGYIIYNCPIAGCGTPSARIRDHLLKHHGITDGTDRKRLAKLCTALTRDSPICSRPTPRQRKRKVWPPHLNRYVCILDTLDGLYDTRHDPELLGIRLNLTNKEIVATILLLCDILKPVNMLSLHLQEEDVQFTSLPQHVKHTTDLLHGVLKVFQEHMATLHTTDTEFAKCQGIFDEIDDRTQLVRRMRGTRAQQMLMPVDFLRETGIPLIYALISEIEDAFTTGAPVLCFFNVLDPKNLLSLSKMCNDYIKTK